MSRVAKGAICVAKEEGATWHFLGRIPQKVWHWANIVVFSLLGVATTVSALRLIVNNVQNYHFFADT